MNKHRGYILLIVLLTATYIFVEFTKPKELDLTDSYTNSDTIPLGTYILHEQLPVLFPDQDISLNDATIFNKRDEDWQTNWIFINNTFNFDRQESELLIKHVSEGGNVFLSARRFEGLIADTLNIETSYLPHHFQRFDFDSLNHIEIELVDLESKWSIDSRFIQTAFTSIDTLKSDILGLTEDEDINFLRTKFGEGSFYLHSNPELYGNYIVRDSEFTQYVFGTLSYLPVAETMWDEYYKVGRKVTRSPMRYVIANEYLKWAWLLALISVLLYFLFRSKRLQRIIPVLESPQNSSIEFTTTITQLYLEKKSHKAIAEKKIKFFLDQLRQRLRVDTNEINSALYQTISDRSGVNRSQIDELFTLILSTENAQRISESDLMYLNQQIELFNRNSLR